MHEVHHAGTPAKCTTADHRNYNFQWAWLWVQSEHTIGFLNGRWSSLKELWLHIASDEAFAHATDWVLVCCVLHQICMAGDDDASDRVQIGVEPPVVVQGLEDVAEDERLNIMEQVCSYMRASGSHHASRR